MHRICRLIVIVVLLVSPRSLASPNKICALEVNYIVNEKLEYRNAKRPGRDKLTEALVNLDPEVLGQVIEKLKLFRKSAVEEILSSKARIFDSGHDTSVFEKSRFEDWVNRMILARAPDDPALVVWDRDLPIRRASIGSNDPALHQRVVEMFKNLLSLELKVLDHKIAEGSEKWELTKDGENAAIELAERSTKTPEVVELLQAIEAKLNPRLLSQRWKLELALIRNGVKPARGLAGIFSEMQDGNIGVLPPLLDSIEAKLVQEGSSIEQVINDPAEYQRFKVQLERNWQSRIENGWPARGSNN